MNGEDEDRAAERGGGPSDRRLDDFIGLDLPWGLYPKSLANKSRSSINTKVGLNFFLADLREITHLQ